MKNCTIFFMTYLCLLLSFYCQGQESTRTYNQQIGITGLPIIYVNGLSTTRIPIRGVALYGNFGWVKNNLNVIGLRPFGGLVDYELARGQRINSVGTNIYYRRYLNEKRGRFFLDVNMGFGYIWYTSPIAELQNLNGLLFNFAAGPGVNYEIKNGLNFEFLLQYLQMKNITSPSTTTGRTIIPSFGIQKFF